MRSDIKGVCLMSKKRTPFEDILKDLENIVERMLEDLDIDPEHFKPAIYGFSITQKPGELPEIHEFNFSPEKGFPEPAPYMDVVESDTQVHVMVELPSIDRERIGIRCSPTNVQLRIRDSEQSQVHNIELPARVDPKTSKATYRNGVLEITLNKVEDPAHDVHIE
jgi:HSP20 family protein